MECEVVVMPQVVTGSCSAEYKASEEYRAPYYGSEIADVRPQVLKAYAKMLPDRSIVAYGEYEVLILFVHKDSNGVSTCFLNVLKKTFSEMIEPGDLPETFKTAETSQISAVASFSPQAACRRSERSSHIWNIEITGKLAVTLTFEGAAAVKNLHNSPAVTQKAVPDEDTEKEADTKCWRLGNLSEIPFETLFSLMPQELDTLAKENDIGRDK
jgi:hypothetical protein